MSRRCLFGPVLFRRALLATLLFTALTTSACSGCEEELPDEPDGSAPLPDMRALDMPADEPDQRIDEQPDMDIDEPVDMRRRPRLDMEISGFDFGNPDVDMASEPFTLSEVIPPSGPVAGGTLIRLTGTSLTEGTVVYFDGVEIPVEPLGGALVGRAPAVSLPGAVDVKAISPGGETATLEDGFTYFADLGVAQVLPSRIPTTGGVEVEVRGAGFVPETAVSFSGTSALRVEFVSPTILRVISPPRDAGVADVRVTTPNGAVVLDDAITYFEPLSVELLDPSAGRTTGGELVTVRGHGFSSDMTVTFDAAAAQVVSVNANQGTAIVRTPSHAPGLVDVTVSDGFDVARAEDAFYYRADDSTTIAAISPDFGPVAGGNKALVIGVGLDAPDAVIEIGGAEAAVIEGAATWARIDVPPGTLGAADVSVDVAGVEASSLPGAYTYLEDLWLDQVDPNSGPSEGGTVVTLRGEGLESAEKITFGGLRAEVVSRAADTLTVKAPAHVAGVVDVVVERGGLTASFIDGFTYTEQLQVWGFSPTRGAVSGGTYVSVQGTGFDDAREVWLGGQRASVVRRIDSNNLYLYTPAHPQGDAILRVISEADDARAPYPYYYFNPATRFGGAAGSQIEGAVNVSVYDTGGAPIPSAFVMLSTRPDTSYQGMTNSDGQITLSGPDVLGAQTVTAIAAGYSATSVQAVDAENLTVFLNRTTPNPGNGGSGDPPPFGIIRGDVRSIGKLADPNNQKTYDMAIIGTTSVSQYGGNPNPGTGSVVIGDGGYEIISRIGDLAVIALCGVYDEETQSFDPQYMAIERYLVIGDQQTRDVDLLCDIPLDQELDVKLINPVYNPAGPDNNVATVYWDFGFEGIFEAPVEARGLGNVLRVERLPELSGVLADVSFSVIAGSYTGDFAPYTQTAVSGVTDLDAVLIMPPLIDVPEAVSPLPDAAIVNSEIRWDASGPYPADMHVVVLRNALGLPVWTFTVPGQQNYVRIPDFPDFSGLPLEERPTPYPDEQLFLSITSVRIPEFDYSSFTYEDFGLDRWEAFALTRWALRFLSE